MRHLLGAIGIKRGTDGGDALGIVGRAIAAGERHAAKAQRRDVRTILA